MGCWCGVHVGTYVVSIFIGPRRKHETYPDSNFLSIFVAMRFFQSLSTRHGESQSAPVSDQPPRGDASLQLVATGVGVEREEPKEEQVAVLNFSMEGILFFQNQHLIHKTVADPPKSPVRKRPNYDNRKRAFLAQTLPEKKKPPACSKVPVFVKFPWLMLGITYFPKFVIQYVPLVCKAKARSQWPMPSKGLKSSFWKEVSLQSEDQLFPAVRCE